MLERVRWLMSGKEVVGCNGCCTTACGEGGEGISAEMTRCARAVHAIPGSRRPAVNAQHGNERSLQV